VSYRSGVRQRLVPAAFVGLVVGVLAQLLTDRGTFAVILGLVALAAAALLPTPSPGGRRSLD